MTMKMKRRRPRVEVLESRAMLAAGALDTSFGGTGIVTTQTSAGSADTASAVVVQPDLKTVVAGGDFVNSGASGTYDLAVVRYNQNGSLDTSFGSGGKVLILSNSGSAPYEPTGDTHQVSVALGPGGTIFVAGSTINAKTSQREMMVAELNPNGSLDTSFGSGGKVVIPIGSWSIQADGLAVLSDGDVLVSGAQYYLAGKQPTFVVARLTPTGALDPTFGPGGKGYYAGSISGLSTADWTSTMGLDASGNILIGIAAANAASPTGYSPAVVRLTPGGSLDTTVGSGGVLTLSSLADRFGRYGVSGIGLEPDGQVVVAGTGSPSGATTSFVARLNANGTLDTTFGTGGIFLDTVLTWANGLAVQPNGEILLQGINTLGASEAYQVDRVLAGGTSLDPAFGSGGSVQIVMLNESWECAAIALGPDGKITGVGGGGATSSATDFLTFRLLNDITSDTAAAAPASSVSAPSAARIMALTPDLIASALDSPDLGEIGHPLPKRSDAVGV